MDEVTFIIQLLKDNWTTALNTLTARGEISNSHQPTPHGSDPTMVFIDIRSIEPKKGRRVDVDSKSVVVVYEDSSSTEYPTIDYAVRNETFTFTLHIRVLHRRDFSELTFSRDRLQALYRIARYIVESNSLRPTVYDGSNVLDSAELIKLTGRSEANDRGKKLLGYRVSIELKRFGRNT
tara:strand:- start:2833 stop:3369 length:537 start_codon:yes stop_codon:yes gene_type:complete